MADYTPEFIQESAARANANMIAYFQQEIPQLLGQHHSVLPELSKVFQMSNDVEAYINGGFINRIGGLYTPEEREFILDTSRKFERVKLGFAYFSLLRSTHRPFEALRLAEHQLRTGWQKTGVPLGFNQTVGDHLQSIRKLAFMLYFDDPNLKVIEDTAAYHDAGEPVIGDFTPHCPISRPDKARIEMLGVRLITQHCIATDSNPMANWIYDAVSLYDGTDPEREDIRSKVRDCDLLEMCSEALFMMAHAPQDERVPLNENLQEFWDYVGARLTTKRGKDFFESLETSRYACDLTPEGYKDVMAHAHRYMILNDDHPALAQLKFRQGAVERMQKEKLYAQERTM